MSGAAPRSRRHAIAARSGKLPLALMLLGTMCIVVVESLHGHDCSGEGCVLCLAAGCASGALWLCVGALVVRPLMALLVRLRPLVVAGPFSYRPFARGVLPAGMRSACATQTPVALRVRLLI